MNPHQRIKLEALCNLYEEIRATYFITKEIGYLIKSRRIRRKIRRMLDGNKN